MRHCLSPAAESSYNWPRNRASESTRQREPFMSHEPSTPTSPSETAPRADLPKTQPMQHGPESCKTPYHKLSESRQRWPRRCRFGRVIDGLHQVASLTFEIAGVVLDLDHSRSATSDRLVAGRRRRPKKVRARCRAASPGAMRCAGSEITVSTARASAAVSPGATRTPDTPSSTTSGMPPTRVAMLGQPKHIASTMLRQKLSESDVNNPRPATCK